MVLLFSGCRNLEGKIKYIQWPVCRVAYAMALPGLQWHQGHKMLLAGTRNVSPEGELQVQGCWNSMKWSRQQ